MEPNKEFITKWVAALRSGEYKQAKVYWKDSCDRYCCLGVANVLSGENCEENGCIIENSVYNTTQMTGLNNTQLETLVNMNDTGRSFNEIADYLELTYLN